MNNPIRKKILCILGFGYTANYVAAKLAKQGFMITGTSRDPEKRFYYSQYGYTLIDPTIKTDVMLLLQQATHVLISIPPSPQLGDPILEQYSTFFGSQSHTWHWIGYLSSTSIYGDHHGDWVDETSASLSLGDRGKVRLEAEKAWSKLATDNNLPLHIFRLAGIYGPYKNVLSDIMQGKTHSMYKENQFFSRIHVEDITKVILASTQYSNPCSVYNVCDDMPAPSHEVDEFAAKILNKSRLILTPVEQASLSNMAREFYSNNRRVNNQKIKDEFNLQLSYPSYKQGLLTLFKNEEYASF